MIKNQLLTIAIITLLLSGCLGGFAIAQSEQSDFFIFIESRFKLWDSNEKMLDNNFTINILTLNATANHTYKIVVNDNTTIGNFTGMKTVMFNVTQSPTAIHIEIDGIPVMTVSGIVIISGITQSGISQIDKPFVISLSPFEWSSKQWNIFYAIVVSALISIYISYTIVIHYRKFNGVREIK